MASSDLRAELKCSICLSIYTDPVTLRCGHNFCQVCIDQLLSTQREARAYSCPDCREVFHQRPALHRNLALRNIAERFLAESQSDREDSGIFCSYCIHGPVPAAKSCLLCEASLCTDHLRVHSKSEEHVLSEPTIAPGERKCSVHKKVLMYYCTKDGTCVCLSCCLNGEHRGHQVDLMNEASEKKRKRLSSIVEALTTRREKADQKVKSLYEQRRKMPGRVEGLRVEVNYVFEDLKRKLEDLRKKVLGELSRQEKQASTSVGDLIHRLEIKKEDLSRKLRDVEQLYNAPDPVTLLQEASGNSVGGLENDDDDDDEEKDNNQDDLDQALISVMMHKGLSDIMTSVRKGFLTSQWAPDIFLDERTASNNVHISGDQKTASWSQKSLGRQETPERFQSYKVLSSTRFSSGRHYWEVEASKPGNWRIGVAYSSIERKGDQSNIGNNDKSWGLRWWSNQLSVRYDCKEINLTPKLMSQKIGMYLDYEEGRLSFYEMCSPIRHLHTYKITFTEPVHVVLALWNNAWLKL